METYKVSDDNNSKCHKRIIGYYNGAREITEEQIKKLTHIIFNGIQMQKDGKIDFGSDEKRLMFIDIREIHFQNFFFLSSFQQ